MNNIVKDQEFEYGFYATIIVVGYGFSLLNCHMSRINLLLDENVILHVQSNNEVNI